LDLQGDAEVCGDAARDDDRAQPGGVDERHVADVKIDSSHVTTVEQCGDRCPEGGSLAHVQLAAHGHGDGFLARGLDVEHRCHLPARPIGARPGEARLGYPATRAICAGTGGP
jgi:hypothetical protein